MIEPHCKSCKFFFPVATDKATDLGVCRRFPAVWTNDTAGFQFPGMKEEGWCGGVRTEGNCPMNKLIILTFLLLAACSEPNTSNTITLNRAWKDGAHHGIGAGLYCAKYQIDSHRCHCLFTGEGTLFSAAVTGLGASTLDRPAVTIACQ